MKAVVALLLIVAGTTPAWAPLSVAATSVPTLDDGGLVVLVALVGVVGGLIARRRRK